MLIDKFVRRGLISPPKWLQTNLMYGCYMGSYAYGVHNEDSDMDCYGICIPLKEMIFPHLSGEILGFGRQIKRFEEWQEHHVYDQDAGKEYDFHIYGIVKFFHLAMDNNPNIIDALFVPRHCIWCSTEIGELIRENRKIFLHKGSWHRFKGYAYAQLNDIRKFRNANSPKRQASIQEFGYDVKFAYHIVRLIDEVEQILTLGDLDLQRAAEQMKSVRRGEWTKEKIIEWFELKEKQLEQIYLESKLPYGPDESKIKSLLLQCLEIQYGSLEKCVSTGYNILADVAAIEAAVARIRAHA